MLNRSKIISYSLRDSFYQTNNNRGSSSSKQQQAEYFDCVPFHEALLELYCKDKDIGIRFCLTPSFITITYYYVIIIRV